MKAVGALHGAKPIIMIAHQLSTVRIYNQIVLLDKGHQIGIDSFDELIQKNATFQKMLAG